jgi:hypothetical protein
VVSSGSPSSRELASTPSCSGPSLGPSTGEGSSPAARWARRWFLATRRSSRAVAFLPLTWSRRRFPKLSGTFHLAHPASGGRRNDGVLCNQQLVEELYVERTVEHPGWVQSRPGADRDPAVLPRVGAPSATP